MTPAYIAKLSLSTQKTSIGAQKIDGSSLEIYGMASAMLLIQDNLGRIRFCEKTFLLTNISIEVVPRILFLFLSNADIKFVKLGKLTRRTYIAVKALPTNSWVEHIDKREFAKAILDANSETFIMHI